MAVAVDPQMVAEATALIEATAQVRQNLNATTTAAVTAQVREFDGWYDHDAISKWARSLGRITGSGQRQTASLTSSYLSRLITLLSGHRVRPVAPIPVADLRGVPLGSVFGRLADEHRYLHATRTAPAPPTSDGVHPTGKLLTDDDIQRMIEQRAAVMVDQSLAVAMTNQTRVSLDRADIRGYRRVIHPEIPTLASARDGKPPPPVCGLCVAASTRVYHKAKLMPIHARCRCLPTPIFGEVGGPGDTGAVINESDLGRLYADAGNSTAAAALKRTKYRVETHGELGPQLVLQASPRNGPAAAARRAAADSRPAAPQVTVNPHRVLEVAQKTIADLERRKAAGENVSGPLTFQRGLAKRMRERIASGE